MVAKILKLSDVADNYDLFIIDIWGVLHDGIEPYPNAVEAIKKLQNSGKNIVFLSNTPRPSEETRVKLMELNFPVQEEKIVTSGQFFINEMSNPVVFPALKDNKMHIITNGQDHPLLKHISNEIVITTDVTEAKFSLIIALADTEKDKQRFISEINDLPIDIQLLCPNPDKVAPHGNYLRTLSGYFAEIFINRGGEVHYFGKPHHPIYQYATHGFDIDKSRVLAIGDGMETDILGGHNFGIDTLLISKGIYMDNADITQIMHKYHFKPNYYMDYLLY